MIHRSTTRIEPTDLKPKELKAVASLLSNSSSQLLLVDDEGHQVKVPPPLSRHISSVLKMLQQSRAVMAVPDDELFTTQAAADYLGMSRQHLVDLLEANKIPFHKVGSHRRIRFRDLSAYEQKRDLQRRKTLDKLFDEVCEAGQYNARYTGK